VTLAFLAGVVVLMALDAERGVWIISALVVAGPALAGGWFLVRNRVRATAARVNDTEHIQADRDELPPEPANL
ncbi:MAG: L-asparagine permease, partial [Mycobacterium sp.]